MAKVSTLLPDLTTAPKEQLYEDPKHLQADLQHLKDWLAKQPHLRARTDDQFLVAFLRGSKFSLERAKEKLDSYYTLRSAMPEFFVSRNPITPQMSNFMKIGAVLPLGSVEQQGQAVLMRAGCFDAARAHVADAFALAMRLTDLLLREDAPHVGTVAVVDLDDVTLAHAAQYTPALVKRVTTYYQDGYPGRPKAIHYLNMRPYMETVLNLFKSVLKEKIRKRIFIHTDLKSLHNSVPRRILPKEYGGEAGPLQDIADAWAEKLQTLKYHFEEEAQFGCDEKKRPGKPKTHEDLFGVEGSFRQLAVD